MSDPESKPVPGSASADLLRTALDRLGQTDTLPLDAHAGVHDEVHAAIRDVLDAIDED